MVGLIIRFSSFFVIIFTLCSFVESFYKLDYFAFVLKKWLGFFTDTTNHLFNNKVYSFCKILILNRFPFLLFVKSQFSSFIILSSTPGFCLVFWNIYIFTVFYFFTITFVLRISFYNILLFISQICVYKVMNIYLCLIEN